MVGSRGITVAVGWGIEERGRIGVTQPVLEHQAGERRALQTAGADQSIEPLG
jgi:hypothetical protein